MKKILIALTGIAVMGFGSAAFADQYSQAAKVSTVTIGSTGNWYFYPTTAINIVDIGPWLLTDGTGPLPPAFRHAVANPAGCSDPTRYVLDSNAGNFRDVIDSLKVAGFSVGGGAFLPEFASSGFQFYVSSSKCTVDSPTIVRVRLLNEVYYDI